MAQGRTFGLMTITTTERSSMALVNIVDTLTTCVNELTFAPPVATVYNPLDYARAPHLRYLERYGTGTREILLLGMNPGPWGMAQTGVPFGAIPHARDWLGINEPVGNPVPEHPKRPVQGFACPRVEVSGTRLWGWAQERFGTPEHFFERFFVWNYCPLMFMGETGRNITPNKLKAHERSALITPCDQALRDVVHEMKIALVVGIGVWAEDRARVALDGIDVRVGRVLHPSPASPRANRGWAAQADADLDALGVSLS